MKPRFARLFAASAVAVAAAVCSAQTVSLVEVKVTDLQPYYEADKAINLTPISSPPESLHARVFYDSVANLKRTRPGPDHCIRFYTALISGIGYPNVINLRAINDQRLVRPDRDGKIRPVTVTLVFETGTLPEVGAFGLKAQALNDYFAHAIEIHLVPSSNQASLEKQFEQGFMRGLQAPHPPVTPSEAPVEATEPPSAACYEVNPHPANRAAEDGQNPGVALVATMKPMGCETPAISPSGKMKPSGL
jgi:hypothetical protein